jgi:plastocyanin
VVFLLLAGLVSACNRSDARLRPEAILRDSLGLDDDDRVHQIRLGAVDNRESLDPPTVTVRVGDYVEFLTTDRRVHAVSFVLDSLPPGAADFLRRSGQEASPPLVETGTRFLITLADAPTGRYPFVVIGNGAEARGAVVVAETEE